MSWKIVRLELARTPGYPEGSPEHAFLVRLPIGENGAVQADLLKQPLMQPSVRRIWPGESEKTGVIIPKDDGWVFSYEPGDDDDEPLFRLNDHKLKMGDYLTIFEQGEALPFKVVCVEDAR